MKGTKFFRIGIALVAFVMALLLVGEAGFMSVIIPIRLVLNLPSFSEHNGYPKVTNIDFILLH